MADILYTVIIYPITQILEFVFVFAQKLFKETGLSVIFISTVVSVLCLPLYMVAEKWQQIERDIEKKLKPKADKIRKIFSGDERYMILSAYYRQNHYHPIYALRSSFGLLIQVPFFIAAYSYLSQLQALKGVSFLFINDLGKPDALLTFAAWGGGINILPVLMTLINCVAGAIYTRGLDIKDKVQIYGMALVFMVLLYNSPSGLVLYWTLNNVFSLLKNGYIKLPFRKKHFLLSGIISTFAVFLLYYILFIHHGNLKIRTLIAVLSVVTGILPWIIPFWGRIIKKIKYISWTSKENFIILIFSLLILWMATGIFLPSMLIGASPQEFSFIDNVKSPISFIFNASVQSLGLFIFYPLMIYFLFSEKVKRIISVLMVTTSFSALCNMFVFPGNYGLISSDLVFTGTVSHNLREISINIFVLAILFAFLFLIYIRGGKKILSFLVITLFIALVPISIKNLFFINAEFNKLSQYYTPEHKTEESISPIFHFSKTGKNVLVIMLDMAESVFVPYIFEESHELYQKYDGFVYYPNTVTFNGWTVGGAPPIFGGYEYTPEGINSRSDISLHKKRNEALLMMPMLFSSSGFSVAITDPPYADNNWIPDLRIYDDEKNISGYITDGAYTDLWLKRNNIVLPPHSEVLKRNILWYAIFREIPLAFRQAVYYTGSWCAPFSEYRMRLFLNGYAMLDYLDELTDIDPQKEKSAVLMVNNTTHENWFLQAPDYKPQISVTDYGKSPFSKEVWYHVNAAAIKRLSDYFDFLKSHNIYDNTRIILVSDHGLLDVSHVTKTGLPFHVDQFNSLLFIKDFNAKGAMKTDMTFMTNADIPFFAMKELIENPVNPFTGNAITDGQKNNPQLILIKRVQDKNETEIELNTQNTYYIRDNIFDENNWNRPEKYP
ncbi:MAG: YidC/Oxa1 family membrane protein insertase [Treponema sp.]|jgi:YidC/Oxa1 family membrane protein insertase|nr:YidC/Oxa1 family membrane protein insertase [Treponema sp.]